MTFQVPMIAGRAARTSGSAGRQRGAVLLVALMILLILTMITLVAMRGATLQERIAGSTRSEDFSLQMAEATLRGVESQIGDTSFVPIDRPGSVFESTSQVTWYTANPKYFGGTDRPLAPAATSPDPSALPDSKYLINTDLFPEFAKRNAIAPRFFVEAVPVYQRDGDSLEAGGTEKTHFLYRVTAAGYSGPSPDGSKAPPFSVILQSTFYR